MPKKNNSNSKYVLIVESPAKAKTIERYLGKDYKVIASVGHIRDLPKKKFGIDIENNFEPEFEIMHGKKKVIDDIKSKVKNKEILLATDMDREGEAIAWHLAYLLNVDINNKNRILFSEITKNAINKSINNPNQIDVNKVDAQLARRFLDRIVGYKVSPLVWKIFKNYNTSAGRVQSAALKMIIDKERKIFNFKPKKYFKVYLEHNNLQIPLTKENNKVLKAENVDEKKKNEIISYLKDKNLSIKDIKEKTTKRNPPAPFITSTLQQSGVSLLNWSSKKTMKIAQDLYEGVKTNDGQIAFITYMRTDSAKVSIDAQNITKKYLENKYGNDYVGNYFYKKSKSKTQDAHEAIRPTNIDIDISKAKDLLSGDHLKLYTLIWNRFIASQSTSSVYNDKNYIIQDENKKYTFELLSKKMIFDGFEKFWSPFNNDIEFNLDKNEKFDNSELKSEEKETNPPPRYTEASLVKELEKNGVGRPSTYSSIISTLVDRKYVNKIQKNTLQPTVAGFIVSDFLETAFPEIIDLKFTANMEEELDEIEEGDKNYKVVLNDFYKEFEPHLNQIDTKIKSKEINLNYESDVKCTNCDNNMFLNFGRYGLYLSCKDCKETQKVPFFSEGVTYKGKLFIKNFIKEAIENDSKEIGEKCPKCDSELVIKKGRYGEFIACSNYPNCKYTKNIPARGSCHVCGSEVGKMKSKKGRIFFRCTNKDCGKMSWLEPSNYKCPECEEKLFYKNIKNTEFLFCEKNKKTYKTEEIEND